MTQQVLCPGGWQPWLVLFLFRFDLLLHLELYPVVATFHLVVESAGRQIKVPVPRTVRLRASWQRREHACRPFEGKATVCSKCWKVLQS